MDWIPSKKNVGIHKKEFDFHWENRNKGRKLETEIQQNDNKLLINLATNVNSKYIYLKHGHIWKEKKSFCLNGTDSNVSFLLFFP